MKKPIDPRTDQIKKREQQPTDPGPTTGGMGSIGSQPNEPSLEEKLGRRPDEKRTAKPQSTGHAARRGVPGFHPDAQTETRPEGSGMSTPASLELDPDNNERVNTGTGDQPGNTGGSRTGTPSSPSQDSIAPQGPDNNGSTAKDLDDERSRSLSSDLDSGDSASKE